MTLPSCPHCGKFEGVYINGQWHGSGAYYYNENGEIEETSSDGLYMVLSKTIRCAGCEKIRRDLFKNDNGQIMVKYS